jgi:hypothetical protein
LQLDSDRKFKSLTTKDTKEHKGGFSREFPVPAFYAANILGIPLSPSRMLPHRSD